MSLAYSHDILQYLYAPLHIASFNGHVVALNELLKAGADVHATNNVCCHCLLLAEAWS